MAIKAKAAAVQYLPQPSGYTMGLSVGLSASKNVPSLLVGVKHARKKRRKQPIITFENSDGPPNEKYRIRDQWRSRLWTVDWFTQLVLIMYFLIIVYVNTSRERTLNSGRGSVMPTPSLLVVTHSPVLHVWLCSHVKEVECSSRTIWLLFGELGD